MNNIFLKIQCFVIGYDYDLILAASAVSKKQVKKYFSAIIIISILWFFIGYNFSERYFKLDTLGSLFSAIIFVIIIISVERQILLTFKKSTALKTFRVILGLIMAFIGSLIIDQIIFKDDVEKRQLDEIQTVTNRLLPIKTIQLEKQISEVELSIQKKEKERKNLEKDLQKNPTIRRTTSKKVFINNSSRDSSINTTDTYENLINPNWELLKLMDSQIKNFRDQKLNIENGKINVRNSLEAEIKMKKGLLDEVNVLFDVILSSWISILIYFLFFLFFLMIEMLIVVGKSIDGGSDYEYTLQHQMDMRIAVLDKMKKSAELS